MSDVRVLRKLCSRYPLSKVMHGSKREGLESGFGQPATFGLSKRGRVL